MSEVRVLHVLPWITSGGVEKRRLVLAEQLDARFVQGVYCLEAKDPLRSEIEACGVEVRTGGRDWSPRDLAALRGLATAIEAFEPDILHAGVHEAVVLATTACLTRPRLKLIVEEIGYPLDRSWIWDGLMAGLYRRADAVVAVSNVVADYIERKLRPGSKLRRIVNGVAPLRSVSAPEAVEFRRRWSIPEDAVVVVGVGRMHEHTKRMGTSIRAFAELAERWPGAHLVLVGDGPDRAGLEALADGLVPAGARGRVVFTGYERDVALVLAASDVFVLSSNRESFGQTVVEAMLAGRPVVSTAVGGPAEIVVPHRTGFFVPVDDSDALAAALEPLLADEGLRRRLGDAGRIRAEQLYTSDRYCAEVASLYDELAS